MDTTAASVSSISPQVLATLIGRPDAPLILDVRREPAFQSDPYMLAGALRCAPEDIIEFAASQTPQAVVAYCVHGHEVSALAATQLRAAGWSAQRLAGGMTGGEEGVDDAEDIARWRTVRLLTQRRRVDLGVTGERPSRWITRARPKIDRAACPWLIRRFIDPHAEFFYVPTAEVFDKAKDLNATAYDIPGAPISHVGDLCSFDTLLHEFELRDAALDALAEIVRGADTERLDLAPQAAGLLAFSLGLSALHATDDHAMLQAAMPLYDALYAWCREARSESHAWKPETMG